MGWVCRPPSAWCVFAIGTCCDEWPPVVTIAYLASATRGQYGRYATGDPLGPAMAVAHLAPWPGLTVLGNPWWFALGNGQHMSLEVVCRRVGVAPDGWPMYGVAALRCGCCCSAGILACLENGQLGR